MAGTDGTLKALGYEQLTSFSSAKALQSIPSTFPNVATLALIQAEDQTVRWRDDGSAPTTSAGQRLQAGDDMWYVGDNLSKLQFIEETATAKLNVTYYKG